VTRDGQCKHGPHRAEGFRGRLQPFAFKDAADRVSEVCGSFGDILVTDARSDLTDACTVAHFSTKITSRCISSSQKRGNAQDIHVRNVVGAVSKLPQFLRNYPLRLPFGSVVTPVDSRVKFGTFTIIDILHLATMPAFLGYSECLASSIRPAALVLLKQNIPFYDRGPFWTLVVHGRLVVHGTTSCDRPLFVLLLASRVMGVLQPPRRGALQLGAIS
jgi:hypothetical protein